MVDIKHTEGIDSGITPFDQVIQDIREIRANQEARSQLQRRARSADTDGSSEESLPLFLSTPEDQDWQPADQAADNRPQTERQPGSLRQSALRQSNSAQQSTLRQNASQPGNFQQSTVQQSSWRPSRPQQDVPLQETRYQDTRYQDSRYPDTRYQDTQYQDSPYEDDTWLHDALESDRERVKRTSGATVFTRALKRGVLATTVVAALAALFALEDGRNLISHASASLAAALPGFTTGIIRPAPAKAQIAEATPAAPTPVVTVAVAPTREAIATAYQTALQSQPEIRQPVAAAPPVVAAPAPPPAPAPAPAVRRLDPDELATLLKRAQSLLDMGDLPGARLLLTRAADAHEARAAFILAQTYDPAVLGTQDTRSVTPDPDAAKLWYQKAAQFGSQEAQQRLAQMQN